MSKALALIRKVSSVTIEKSTELKLLIGSSATKMEYTTGVKYHL